MFKKFMLSVVATVLATSTAFACWFTQENFNNAYFAGVNFYVEHYSQTSNLSKATYRNGQSVSLPLTAWFKVSPRTYSVNGAVNTFDIRVAKLYYKILPGGVESSSCKWRLAKAIDMGGNPKWRMDFSSPVKLFGQATITTTMIASNGDTISSGDHIVMAWYIADNSPDCIANAEDITVGQNAPVITVPDNDTYASVYANEFRPAYVMRVVYNGKTTPGR